MKTTLLASVSSAALFFMAGSVAFAGSPITPITVLPALETPSASGNWYASVFAGGSVLQDVETGGYNYFVYDYTFAASFDTGYVVGATIGRRINDNWRVEGELSYASYKAASYELDSLFGNYSGDLDGELSATYLLANVWYDIPNSSRFTPYIGGGLGVAKVDDSVLSLITSDARFAYQIGAGVNYGISDRISLDVGYRYKAVDDINIEAVGFGFAFDEVDVHTHTLQAGLRFDF